MSDSVVDSLVLDLLEWIGPTPRPYHEVLDAWRTSCPRLPIWEEARERGFLLETYEPGSQSLIVVSALGHEQLAKRRPSTSKGSRPWLAQGTGNRPTGIQDSWWG